MQKTMLSLCKEDLVFDPVLIKKTGLKSHSYYTSVLLLEECLFNLKFRRSQSEAQNYKRVSSSNSSQQNETELRYWLNLIEIYSQNQEYD